MEREQQRLKVKCFCCAVLCVSFMWQMFKTCMIKLWVIEGPNTCDQIALCVLHSFLVRSPNEIWLHTCNPCVITTWRLGLWAPLVAHYDNEHWNAVSVTSKGPWHWGHNNELDLLSTEGFIIKFRAKLFIAGLR